MNIKLSKDEFEELIQSVSDVILAMNKTFEKEIKKIIMNPKWKPRLGINEVSFLPLYVASQFSAMRAYNNEVQFKRFLEDFNPMMLAEEQLKQIIDMAKKHVQLLREECQIKVEV